MCIRASLPRVSVNIFFSNERCTLLLWTIIADWIQFANSQFSDKRQAARGVGLLEVFPWSFCVDEQFGTVLALYFFHS